jgi:hypothetical protein
VGPTGRQVDVVTRASAPNVPPVSATPRRKTPVVRIVAGVVLAPLQKYGFTNDARGIDEAAVSAASTRAPGLGYSWPATSWAPSWGANACTVETPG